MTCRPENEEFVKNNFMDIPPVFTEIQKHSKTSWREMFQVYNMGHRMEIYCPKENVNEIKSLSESFGIHAQEIGETLPSRRKDIGNVQNHTEMLDVPRALQLAFK